MFEQVARRPALPRARQAGAMLLSLGLNSLVVGLTFATGGQLVSEVAGQARADDLRLVEVDVGVQPPGLPAPAAGGGGAKAVEALDDDGLAQAEAPATEPDEPGVAPRVESEEGAGRAPEGTAPGQGEGAGDGEGAGVGSGQGEGEGSGEGTGAGAPRTVSKVVPRRVVKPLFPPEARALGLAEVRCVADVEIDERGRPTAVTVRDCPPVYRDAVRRAMLAWRFEPAMVDGRAVAARFVQPFRFELGP